MNQIRKAVTGWALLALLLLAVCVGCGVGPTGRQEGRFLEEGEKAILILLVKKGDPNAPGSIFECTQESQLLRCVYQGEE